METNQHQVVFPSINDNFKPSNDFCFINFYRIGHIARQIFTISDLVWCDSIYLFSPFKFIHCTKVFWFKTSNNCCFGYNKYCCFGSWRCQWLLFTVNLLSHFCTVLSLQHQLGLERKCLIQFFPFIPHVHLSVSKNDQRHLTLETKS